MGAGESCHAKKNILSSHEATKVIPIIYHQLVCVCVCVYTYAHVYLTQDEYSELGKPITTNSVLW